ncbi:helix-turn-helix domain-containing protein [Sphingobacterium lactis]|uniref:helix-turn-helix domain-containing protein n=2 Tax=Sphingobacterium TaxID=28453 RepID=UPI003EC5AFDD
MLDQKGFGDALGMQQSGVSIIEQGKTKLTPKTRSRICNTFFIDPLFFEEGSGADMFLEGKERDAWTVADRFRKQKSSSTPRGRAETSKSEGAEIQAIVLERLENEIALKDELLKSKDDIIVVLKEQLNQMNSNYENLYREFSELKKFVNQNIVDKLDEINDHVVSGRTGDPNAINPARNSG